MITDRIYINAPPSLYVYGLDGVFAIKYRLRIYYFISVGKPGNIHGYKEINK